jgi:hypothetical protein
MTPNNFKCYLQELLFLHTQKVIKRQMAKIEDEGDEDENHEDDGTDIEDEE